MFSMIDFLAFLRRLPAQDIPVTTKSTTINWAPVVIKEGYLFSQQLGDWLSGGASTATFSKRGAARSKRGYKGLRWAWLRS